VSRYDRYVLSQFLLFFGFFSLILVAVFWINRAVVLFDRLIGGGHSAMVFLEFTALTLPNLIRMVLPMAAFAAALWVTNRLGNESELTVMQATGSSPWQLARPALAFGILTALMMSILTHFLLPASINQLALREAELTRNLTARLLSEGKFLNPSPGVTFYIREIDADGTLNDVFLSDRRAPDQRTIYTGRKAFLVRDEERTNLVMVDGIAQRLNRLNQTLSMTIFTDFSYDISSLVKPDVIRARDLRTISTFELITTPNELAQSEGYAIAVISEELHMRFARALIAIAVTLIGFSTLLLGGYSRFGVWRQVLLAFMLLIFLEVLRGVIAEPALENPNLWPLYYLPTLIGVAIAALFLKLASRPLKVLLKCGAKLLTLDLYFARRFTQSFLLIGAVFLTLIMLIDLIEQLRRFRDVDVGFGQLVRLTLMNAPKAISEILPLLMILATIVMFVGLARSSELVVARASGRSGIRALAAPLVVAALIGGLAVSTLNPIVATSSNRYQQLSETFRAGGPAVLSLSGEGLWMRQGSPDGQSVIHATGYVANPLALLDVTILTYAPDGLPVQRIFAQSARLDDTDWELKHAKVWPLEAGQNPEANAVEHQTLRLPTTLTQERIRDYLGSPSSISVYDLPATIRDLAQAGFSTKSYEVWLQVELARPLFLMAMVLVGAAFTMRHTRFGGTGLSVLAAVMLGFTLYFIRNFAQILGENGQIPIMLAAWAPPVAAILLTSGLLLHAEDG